MCEQSRVGAELRGEALANAVSSATAAAAGSTPLDLAIQGGDDYAVLCSVSSGAGDAVSAAAADSTSRCIGVVTAAELGIVLSVGDTSSALPASGWDPFRGASGGVAE
jgi:thiamine monophosphate kinase